MDINFNGFQENILTFECTSTVAAGDPVKMSANGKVTVCSAGDNFIGIAKSVRDGYAAVQLSGYIEAPFTGSGVSIGYTTLTADSDGAVKAAQTGREYLVLTVDSSTVGFIL